jgi:hypothetical protein
VTLHPRRATCSLSAAIAVSSRLAFSAWPCIRPTLSTAVEFRGVDLAFITYSLLVVNGMERVSG